jgi:hypothetical protein
LTSASVKNPELWADVVRKSFRFCSTFIPSEYIYEMAAELLPPKVLTEPAQFSRGAIDNGVKMNHG